VRLGVGSNPRRYQVYSGNTLVYDYTEPSAISKLPSLQTSGGDSPANYLWLGMIAEMKRGNSARTPGTLAGFTLSDSQVPLVAGTAGQIARLTTVNEDIDPGTNYLPGSFFDGIEYNSPDVIPNIPQCGFTVQSAGLYKLACRIRHTQSDAQTFVYFSAINGVLDQWGRSNNMDRGNSSGCEFLVRLSAGDTVRLGYNWSGARAVRLTGSLDGSESWMNIVKVS
jgi:hypothetical protein